MGLSAGPVAPRVHAEIKAGLLELVDHAGRAGWSVRHAADTLGVDHMRVLRWQQRRVAGRLEDSPAGPNVAVHALLDFEREAIVKLAEEWGGTDRSHRKLAHRGSRLGWVHVSESTVLRVLDDQGIRLPGGPVREHREKKPFPDWALWRPRSIWIYDFTHFTAARRCALAIMDLVSRKWITTLVSAQESSLQVETAFLSALHSEDLGHLAERRMRAELTAPGPPPDEQPVLLAVSDNGPQMRSADTRTFMAACLIGQHFGRPHTPNDQAWIESLFSHVKGEWPHLTKIRDPFELEAELDAVHTEYNTVRLHAGLGYVTPDDEHTGRADAIRTARAHGLQQAREHRIAYRRKQN
ncbi:integrase core domain-containing protein [Streptomyces sp. NBC_01142]|uniref:integrase core domain-containing protein n=1 Tax=Streptomyces sp. NBC_01142 TaxID=2975865 RepID=UPI0022518AC3|nr:integrase core domain-containing protein [Streptomyces sp. NBC_01142]MCX4821257.1 integrase core domain-containing protein [Streptomyces sp. NBC_01142]MCX4821577.1 integrase core domain-containing protein [Streptomyces sp. NBC_01142]MCX4823558.1 integrase core domain-containing protein [Streptomyces sp. NBC_01142]MCX4825223.1 integrase core domain-containing protein [Streptomyces sp. NBC_01142]MCX4826248.1 integrase core domain-containing protein [Streptomyces sp. NBC_01142]